MVSKNITYEQVEARALRQGVESRIRRLRVLIDQIERTSLDNLDRAERGEGRYAAVAEVFVREIPQGLVNASIEQLVQYAACADIYHAEDAAGQQ